jgi:hypothetical protein
MIFEQVVEHEDGWSDWIQPKHDGYLMKCCGCGLVHELQFRVVEDTPGDMVDTEQVVPGLVIFRASRVDAPGGEDQDHDQGA